MPLFGSESGLLSEVRSGGDKWAGGPFLGANLVTGSLSFLPLLLLDLVLGCLAESTWACSLCSLFPCIPSSSLKSSHGGGQTVYKPTVQPILQLSTLGQQPPTAEGKGNTIHVHILISDILLLHWTFVILFYIQMRDPNPYLI